VLGIRLDATGHAYVAALISASDAPTTNGSRHNGLGDAYVAKLSPDGTRLLYGSYYGGNDFDGPAKRLWLGDDGSVYVVGATYSRNLPVPSAHQPQFGGGVVDAILAKFDPVGRLVLSTYIGGTLEDDAWGPSVDAAGNIFVVGRTQSPDFETTEAAFDSGHNGDSDVFLQIYSPRGELRYSTFFGGRDFEDGRFLALDPAGRLVVVGTTRSADFPTTPGAYDRRHNGGSDVFVAKFDVRIAGQR